MATKTTSYLVISPHTPEQCLTALDHLVDAKVLDRVEFGCEGGDHTGYARVEARSAEEALAIVPGAERSSARAISLTKFTPEQLRAYHQAP
jgi:hypothetical protein